MYWIKYFSQCGCVYNSDTHKKSEQKWKEMDMKIFCGFYLVKLHLWNVFKLLFKHILACRAAGSLAQTIVFPAALGGSHLVGTHPLVSPNPSVQTAPEALSTMSSVKEVYLRQPWHIQRLEDCLRADLIHTWGAAQPYPHLTSAAPTVDSVDEQHSEQ